LGLRGLRDLPALLVQAVWVEMLAFRDRQEIMALLGTMDCKEHQAPPEWWVYGVSTVSPAAPVLRGRWEVLVSLAPTARITHLVRREPLAPCRHE